MGGWRPFEEAREFVRSLGLKDIIEWTNYTIGNLPAKGTLPEDIPSNPNQTHKNFGWISWEDWLGTS